MGDVIEFLVQLYFSQIYGSKKNKFWSKSMTLALAIAELEGDDDERDDLKFLYHNTSRTLKVPLSVLEDSYEKSFKRSKMNVIRVGGKNVKMVDIIIGLSDSFVKQTIIITKISKRLGLKLEFDMNKYGGVVNE